MIGFTMDGIEYRVFDHLYAVSRCGKVLRNLHPYIPHVHTQGYLMLGRERLMHRVVAACWLDDFDPVKQIHHVNGDKTDNRADNLECVTAKDHFGGRHLDISSRIGKYHRTEDARQKMREFRTGVIDSEETRGKKAAILAVVGPKTQCSFQGISYPSVCAGARAAGIPPATFRQRCKSKNFPDYKLS
jgi:hypothetical protein